MITDKIREDEVSGAVEADWKFAAMVLDRSDCKDENDLILSSTGSASSSSPPSRWSPLSRFLLSRPTSWSTRQLGRNIMLLLCDQLILL